MLITVYLEFPSADHNIDSMLIYLMVYYSNTQLQQYAYNQLVFYPINRQLHTHSDTLTRKTERKE